MAMVKLSDTLLRSLCVSLVGAALCVLCTACTRYLPPPHYSSDPLTAMASLRGQEGAIDSVAADARASFQWLLVEREARAVLVAKRPGRLRLEMLTPTGEMVAITTINGERIVHFVRGAGACYVAPPCAGALGQVLGFSAPPGLLVEALLGNVQLEEAHVSGSHWDDSVGREVLTFASQSVVHELSFDPCTQDLRTARLTPQGADTLSLDFGEWAPAGGGRLPRRLSVDLGSLGAELVVDYLAVDVKMELDADAFSFDCPRGTRVVELDCEASE